jgi:formylmethanofuran dehydrogenase subunit E
MAAEQPKEEAQKVEKQTNCITCNKPLKKLRQYYRNGKFYCTKRCYKKSLTTEEKE